MKITQGFGTGRAAILQAGGHEEPALSDRDEGSANTGVQVFQSQQVPAMTQVLGRTIPLIASLASKQNFRTF